MANGNGITSLNLTDSGELYRAAPIVRVSNPNAEVKHAALSLNVSQGVIQAINIDSEGTYYINSPTLIIDSAPSSDITKFGNGALYHHTDTTASTLHTFTSNLYGQDSVGWELGFWFYPIAYDRNESLILNEDLKIYRDDSDYVRMNVNGDIISSTTGNLNVNAWNYIFIEYKNDGTGRLARVNVNGAVGSSDSALDIDIIDGDRFKLGSTDSASSVQDSVLNSFKGYMDNFHMSQNNVFKSAPDIGTVPTTPQTGSIFTYDYEPVDATAEAVITNGRVSSINITNAGLGYRSNAIPSISISGGQGLPGQFKAQVGLNYDSAAGKVQSLYIIDSGDFYVTPPTIAIDDPVLIKDFIIGEEVKQEALDNGAILDAEVVTWNDSDYKLGITHVGITGQNFAEPVSGKWIVGQQSGAQGYIQLSFEQDTNADQNLIFNELAGSFIDFTESNPFGEPDPEGHVH